MHVHDWQNSDHEVAINCVQVPGATTVATSAADSTAPVKLKKVFIIILPRDEAVHDM